MIRESPVYVFHLLFSFLRSPGVISLVPTIPYSPKNVPAAATTGQSKHTPAMTVVQTQRVLMLKEV